MEDQRGTNMRGKSSLKGSRGISENSIQASGSKEKNVEEGSVLETVRGKKFAILGIDIGTDNFSKKGVINDISRITKAYQNSTDTDVVIKGSVSDSVRLGTNNKDLAYRRSEALKKILVNQGIPAERITTVGTPTVKSGIDPRSISSTTKASQRGATIELIKREKKHQKNNDYTDDIYFVKSEPLIDKTIWDPGRKLGPMEPPRHLIPVKPILAGGLVVGGLLLLGDVLLDRLIFDLSVKYGKDIVEKYVREKIKPQLKKGKPKRNKHDEKKFMDTMLKIILAAGIDESKPHHPLYFLINKRTKKWKARHHKKSHFHLRYAVQAGHILGLNGYGFSFAIENAKSNNDRSSTVEHPTYGTYALSLAVEIGGVPVDYGTAINFEFYGDLPVGTVKKAKFTPGWVNFGNL